MTGGCRQSEELELLPRLYHKDRSAPVLSGRIINSEIALLMKMVNNAVDSFSTKQLDKSM